jgi:hypothetical protein
MSRVTIDDNEMGSPVIHKEPPPSVSLHFSKKAEIQPEGFDTADLKDKVTVTLVGTVTRLEDNEATDWGGKDIGIDIESCRIEGPKGKDMGTSLGAAVDNSRRYVEG